MSFAIEPIHVVIAVTTLVAGFVRGFSGFGGPMVMLPVLGALFPPAATIWLVMWIDVFVNIHLVPEARRHASRNVVLPLVIGSILTLPLGVAALVLLDPALMKKVISFTILLAALILLTGWRLESEAGPKSSLAVGAVSGLVMGATYIAVVTALYLQSGRQSALESRANFIVWGFLMTFVMIGLIAWSRPPEMADWQPILLLTPFYFVGAAIGVRAHHAIDPQRARKAILLLIMAIAATGLVR